MYEYISFNIHLNLYIDYKKKGVGNEDVTRTTSKHFSEQTILL